MTVTATWKGTVLATSDRTVVVERNHYFPPDDVHMEFLEPSNHTTGCPWKGQASYYSVVVGGDRNRDAAWYYPNPSRAAEELAGRIAFWHGVDVKVHRDDDAGDGNDGRRGWRRWLSRQ